MRKCLLALPVVILFACGGGGSTAATPVPASTSEAVTLTETEFSIAPATLRLKAGTYVFHTVNGGKVPHDLHVVDADGNELAASKVIAAGGSADVQATLKAGAYTMYCAVDGHRALGMQGTITVS